MCLTYYNKTLVTMGPPWFSYKRILNFKLNINQGNKICYTRIRSFDGKAMRLIILILKVCNFLVFFLVSVIYIFRGKNFNNLKPFHHWKYCKS